MKSKCSPSVEISVENWEKASQSCLLVFFLIKNECSLGSQSFMSFSYSFQKAVQRTLAVFASQAWSCHPQQLHWSANSTLAISFPRPHNPQALSLWKPSRKSIQDRKSKQLFPLERSMALGKSGTPQNLSTFSYKDTGSERSVPHILDLF